MSGLGTSAWSSAGPGFRDEGLGFRVSQNWRWRYFFRLPTIHIQRFGAYIEVPLFLETTESSIGNGLDGPRMEAEDCRSQLDGFLGP